MNVAFVACLVISVPSVVQKGSGLDASTEGWPPRCHSSLFHQNFVRERKEFLCRLYSKVRCLVIDPLFNHFGSPYSVGVDNVWYLRSKVRVDTAHTAAIIKKILEVFDENIELTSVIAPRGEMGFDSSLYAAKLS